MNRPVTLQRPFFSAVGLLERVLELSSLPGAHPANAPADATIYEIETNDCDHFTFRAGTVQHTWTQSKDFFTDFVNEAGLETPVYVHCRHEIYLGLLTDQKATPNNVIRVRPQRNPKGLIDVQPFDLSSFNRFERDLNLPSVPDSRDEIRLRATNPRAVGAVMISSPLYDCIYLENEIWLFVEPGKWTDHTVVEGSGRIWRWDPAGLWDFELL
jgi:hypothetical protein